MSKKFSKELTTLKEKVIKMGAQAQEMFQLAVKSLVSRDASLIDRILEIEDRVDELQVELDDDVVRLVTVYGPVAFDLRFLLMVTRINTELERIGDQACNMCENVRLLVEEPELKKLVDLPRMAEIAGEMVQGALAAFRQGDTQAAHAIIRRDNEVDALNDQIFRELLTYMLSDSRTITRSLALILTARSLERIADHATNIAEEVIYVVKGEDVRHQQD